MPKQSYALEPNGPKRLQISWGAFWKNITITLDGSTIGTIPDQKTLSQGSTFPLPDGSTLSVQLLQSLAGAELRVLRDGKPLPGSASDPQIRHKTAYGVLFFIGGLNLLLGLAGLFFENEFLQALGAGWYTLIFGMVFIFLGIFTWRRSQMALVIAIVLFALDGFLSFIAMAQNGSFAFGGLIVRVFLIIPLIQGIGAIGQLKKAEG